MSTVLKGIRVLDFGRYIAGPFCAALLADFGADVIRIDRLGGGEDRFIMPVTDAGEGALFLQVNRNKRSIALDIDCPQGRAIVRRLVQTADVVVVNMPPQTLVGLGLDYATLSAIRPDIILTTVSAYGGDGADSRRLGFDGVGQVMSGAVHLCGPPQVPTKANVPVVDFSTALSCALGTMAALYERRASGRGQLVEASLLHTALNLASGYLLEEAALGKRRESTGNRSPICGPSDIFRVTDGWIIVQVLGQAQFKRWTQLVGKPELFGEARFKDDQARGDNGEELSALMAQWCASRSRQEALQALEQARIPAGPVNSPRQALADPHIQASGFLHSMDYPGLPRPAPLVTPPARLSRNPPEIRHRAPTTGEHTDEVLAEIGCSADEIAALRRVGVVGSGSSAAG
ncbi:MAG: CoA transferase [Nevskia sp.]|nr:CoA transferase [Nevskia sp.]